MVEELSAYEKNELNKLRRWLFSQAMRAARSKGAEGAVRLEAFATQAPSEEGSA